MEVGKSVKSLYNGFLSITYLNFSPFNCLTLLRTNVKIKIKQLIAKPNCLIILINLEGIKINKTIETIKTIKMKSNKSIE